MLLYPQPNQRAFYQKLKSSATHVFIYEEPVMIRYCLSKIPIEKLKREAKDKSIATSVDESDCLLLLLLNWFKCAYLNDSYFLFNLFRKCTGALFVILVSKLEYAISVILSWWHICNAHLEMCF